VFTARYAPSPCIRQARLLWKGLIYIYINLTFRENNRHKAPEELGYWDVSQLLWAFCHTQLPPPSGLGLTGFPTTPYRPKIPYFLFSKTIFFFPLRTSTQNLFQLPQPSVTISSWLTVCIVVVVLWVCYLTRICCTVSVLFFFFILDAGLLARSQYPEGPATGHLDTGFSWFSCA